jgi:NitT/TauT family transport system substrate-binding protein
MKSPRIAVLSVSAILMVVVAAVIWHSWSVVEMGRQPVVKIGYLPIYVDLPFFVAVERGYFDQNQVRYESIRFAKSPEIGEAMAQDKIQVGASIALSVVLSSESRDPGKFRLFIVDSENKQDYLSSIVVLKKSGIRSVAELRNKKIASFPGPQALTFCKLVLEKEGLRPGEDVSVTELDADSHLSALESGLVDALFTYEPTSTQAVLEKDAVKILPGAVESRIISPWQAGVWAVTTKFAASNPDLAQRVIRSLYQAIDFIRSNPTEAKRALQKFTSISTTVAEQTPNIPFAKLGEVDLMVLQQHADILQSGGIISKRIITANLLGPQTWSIQP